MWASSRPSAANSAMRSPSLLAIRHFGYLSCSFGSGAFDFGKRSRVPLPLCVVRRLQTATSPTRVRT
jgi:hypothetical protein